MNKQPVTRVRLVMRTKFLVVDGTITVEEAIQQMKADQATSLIVRKRHDDDEYGLVLLSDIVKKVLAPGRARERVNIYEIMSKPVVTVGPEMDVRYCARFFDQFGISVAPVVERGEVIGLVDYVSMVFEGLL